MMIGKFFLDDFTIDNGFQKTGGEAVVYKASHPRLGEVAIKRWTNAAYNIDNEVKMLIQNCDHQNIIQFLGMLVNNESNYIGYIMPYMPLGSLYDGEAVIRSIIFLVIHNKTEKYDQKQISSWITPICRGLSHLHYKNIIHRDIKPNNVLLGKSYDDVKLSDFGMAKSLGNISYAQSKLGTPIYAAPEVLKHKKYDKSVDVYSLSITIWEILHRKIPYYHIILELDFLSKIANGERPQLNSNLSKEVSDLLARCWHDDPSKRATIDDILEFSINKQFLPTSLETSVTECSDFVKKVPKKRDNPMKRVEIAMKECSMRKDDEKRMAPQSPHPNTLLDRKSTTPYPQVSDKYRKETFVPERAKAKLSMDRTLPNFDQNREPQIMAEAFTKKEQKTTNNASSTANNEVIVLGGLINDQPSDLIFWLNWQSKRWEPLKLKLPFKIINHHALSSRGALCVWWINRLFGYKHHR